MLVSLHDLGIIHRDIKPENIFFDAAGALRLGDFGLAINSYRDRPTSRVGTADYMAPEVGGADTLCIRAVPLQQHNTQPDAAGVCSAVLLTGLSLGLCVIFTELTGLSVCVVTANRVTPGTVSCPPCHRFLPSPVLML